jgi:riboflavin kinase / FMN adenylyltransferase
MKISGKIIRGKRKGRKLGFPTVNIELNDKIECGVYAGAVRIANKDYKAGIFVNNEGTLLEAHLIGFSGDLYGKEIGVEIINKIRDVIIFESDKELKEQIKKDIENICLQE